MSMTWPAGGAAPRRPPVFARELGDMARRGLFSAGVADAGKLLAVLAEFLVFMDHQQTAGFNVVDG